MLKRWQFVWLAVAAVMFCVTVPLYARHHPLPIALWAYFLTRLPIVLLLIYWGLRRRTLTTWIFVSILLGIMLGHDLPALAMSLRVLSQIFLRLIRTIIAPLIFATLVVGIAGHSNLKQVGRLALKSLIYFEIVTTLALAIGLVAINISKAGEGVHLAAPAAETLTAPPESAGEMILRAFPENIAKAIAEGQVLQIVVFSVLFGIGLALVREERRRPLLALGESLSETMFKFTNLVMLFAPFGVGAAIAFTVATTGLGVLKITERKLLQMGENSIPQVRFATAGETVNVDPPAITENALECGGAQNQQGVFQREYLGGALMQCRIDASLDQPGKGHAGEIGSDERENSEDEKTPVTLDEKLDAVVIAQNRDVLLLLIFLDAVYLCNLGPLPCHELVHDGLERRHRNTNLLHRVAVADRDFLIRGRLIVTHGLHVHRDTKRSADFVLAPVEPADGGGVVVHGVPSLA